MRSMYSLLKSLLPLAMRIRIKEVMRLNLARLLASVDPVRRVSRMIEMRLAGDSLREYGAMEPSVACILPEEGSFREVATCQDIVAVDRYSYETLEINRSRIEDGIIYIGDGLVFTPEGKCLRESCNGYIEKAQCYASRIPAIAERKQGQCFTIHTILVRGYFHWMIEALCQLPYYDGMDEAATLVMPDLPVYGEEKRRQLEACLPAGVALEWLPADTWLQCDEVIQVSPVIGYRHFAHIHPFARNWVKERMRKAYEVNSGEEKNRLIYINRRNAKIRRILNEDALEHELEKRGFESVAMEKISFADQLRLWAEAKLVVSPHGAGLSNMIFSDAPKIVEIMAPTATPTYMFMANSCGFGYEASFPREFVDGRNFSRLSRHQYAAMRDMDITIDVSDVCRRVDGLLGISDRG
jgi:hypothetical protein